MIQKAHVFFRLKKLESYAPITLWNSWAGSTTNKAYKEKQNIKYARIYWIMFW